MPARNVTKNFDADSMYHVYNRGNDKRVIFHDERDYAVFLSFLKYALLSDESIRKNELVDVSDISNSARFNLRRLGLHGKLELVAFCLMPNHFHLLFYQTDPGAITALMRSIATGYVVYYNKRYNRSGGLFQGVYRASHISKQSYWSHIARYIHLNSLDINQDFQNYNYSSYPYYVNERYAEWLNPALGNPCDTPSEYKKYVSDWIPYRKEAKEISTLLANSRDITVQG